MVQGHLHTTIDHTVGKLYLTIQQNVIALRRWKSLMIMILMIVGNNNLDNQLEAIFHDSQHAVKIRSTHFYHPAVIEKGASARTKMFVS